MAIDTKTTAGGVVLLFLSGGGSYLATNAASGETTTPVVSREQISKNGENQLSLKTSEGQNETTKDVQEENEVSAPVAERSEEESAPASEVSSEPEQTTGQGGETLKNPAEESQPSAGTKISEKIEEAKHLLIKGQEDEDKKWEELAKAINTTAETSDQLKKFCRENLEKTYSEDDETTFKDSIKKCTTLVTFKERAGQLNIKLIEGTEENFTPWSERFNDMTEPEAKKLAEASGETITWPRDSNSASSMHLGMYCKAIEKLNWTTVKTSSSNNTIEREWGNYLKGCALNKDESKDFWTGQ